MVKPPKLWEELCARGVRQGPFYRSLGALGSGEQIGVGFMNKLSGIDHHHFKSSSYALSYVVSGQGHYENHHNGRIYELKTGSFFSRFPKIEHTTTISTGEDWIECFISCGPMLAHSLEMCGTLILDPPCLYLGPSKHWIDAFVELNVLSQDLSENQLQAFMLRCISLLEKIFTAIRAANSGNDDHMIQLACFELSRSFHENFELDNFCRLKGWDYDYFRKKFKKNLGISPAQFRIGRRIDAAKELLMTHSNMKLADCANQLGYSSVYEFCAQFKKVTGFPPGHFRRGKSISTPSFKV